MSKLSAFLHPVTAAGEKEVFISGRFLDEKGKPVPFKVRAITQEEADRLVRRSTIVRMKNGQRMEEFDRLGYNRRLIVAGTVEPDFSSAELCEAYGVADPMLVPGRMLLSGEYGKLLQEILDVSGFDSGADVEGEAKN